MTEAATHFVSPLTFRTLSQNPVLTSVFQDQEEGKIYHISLVDEADVVLVAPASANVLAKAACGIADDLLTTTILACKKLVIFAPAMNSKMYFNPATQRNLATLKEYGYQIIEPEEGDLACGETGIGRLAEIDRILEILANVLKKSSDLKGIKILITAGGTQEPIDPIRFIGNKSSGRMGYALAEAALNRGAEVILVSAPTALLVLKGLEFLPVTTSEQMKNAVLEKFGEVDVVIKAAAVTDFKPKRVSKEKIKKKNKLILELVSTPDILAELGRLKKDQVLVGFAAESENLIANAKEKLKSKNLDLVVANDVSKQDIGIGKELNQVAIIDRLGRVEELPVMSKQEVAQKILDRIAVCLKRKKK
jgi:phosphopantothenoylcysteine decarboxylase/phosphopantothenate--cysteine ligase